MLVRNSGECGLKQNPYENLYAHRVGLALGAVPR